MKTRSLPLIISQSNTDFHVATEKFYINMWYTEIRSKIFTTFNSYCSCPL